jgi:hypothetical protein
MKRLIIVFSIGIFLNSGVPADNLKYIDIKKINIAELKQVKVAFLKIWRQLELDEIIENDNFEKPIKAKKFSESLPFYDMQASCNGEKLLVFQLADFYLLKKDGTKFSVGEGYTGSGGTRIIIFSFNAKAETLKVVYDENVIDVLGLVSSKQKVNCPDIGLALSGNKFKKAKDNSDYGEAILIYSKQKSRYTLPSRN